MIDITYTHTHEYVTKNEQTSVLLAETTKNKLRLGKKKNKSHRESHAQS